MKDGNITLLNEVLTMNETTSFDVNFQKSRNREFSNAAEELMQELSLMLGSNTDTSKNEEIKETLIMTLKTLTGDI
jgi:urease alpha subunit